MYRTIVRHHHHLLSLVDMHRTDLYRLAYVEMRMILAHLLFRFDIEITDECRNWYNKLKPYNLWYKVPLHVRMKRREVR